MRWCTIIVDLESSWSGPYMKPDNSYNFSENLAFLYLTYFINYYVRFLLPTHTRLYECNEILADSLSSKVLTYCHSFCLSINKYINFCYGLVVYIIIVDMLKSA